MVFRFHTEPIFWKGPAPFVFAPIPPEASQNIRELSKQYTYGWGVIPVSIRVGKTRWTTSLFPKDGLYLVPIKKAVQDVESVVVGRPLEVEVTLG